MVMTDNEALNKIVEQNKKIIKLLKLISVPYTEEQYEEAKNIGE